MAVSWLARMAERAPVPVLVLAPERERPGITALRLSPRLSFPTSPRHATLLLVAGDLPGALWHAAKLLHDQIPRPRGVLAWKVQGELPFPDRVNVDGDDVASAAVALHRSLLRKERPSSRELLPGENPVVWKGVGPHGQGGEGMMMGTPYGRPMAMTAEDVRDGLELDRLRVEIGPLFPWLPRGIVLDVALQGDVVQELSLRRYVSDASPPEPFSSAEREAVPLRDIELARARHHLSVTSDLLRLHGLDALAERALRLAESPGAAGGKGVTELARSLARTGALALATRWVGTISRDALSGTGPVARAAGLEEDARSGDPAYGDLGFRPRTHSAGDAEARWRQRLGEAAQAIELAARAGERLRPPGPPLEGIRGPSSAAPLPRLDALVESSGPGMSWDELVTTIVSLDLGGGA